MQIQLLQTEQQEIKPNRYITLTEQKDFCDFLANFQVNPERLAKMRWCGQVDCLEQVTEKYYLDWAA